MSHLAQAFDALLKIHGTSWSFNGTTFQAVAQSGAYAAYNFADGNTAIRILRIRSNALSRLPLKGERLTSPNGKAAIVQRSRRIDKDFSEIEVDEI